MDHLDGARVSIVDADLLGRELVLDQLVFDPLIRERACRVEAECLEVAVVSQGRTLDEVVSNVRDAVTLHLEGGEAAAFGIASAPRIAFTYEAAPPAR